MRGATWCSSSTEGQAPTRTAIDGAVILVGGLLLLAPGFLTDFLGFLCVLPLTRPLVRRAVVGYVGPAVRRRHRGGPEQHGVRAHDTTKPADRPSSDRGPCGRPV